jgi:hypothetical protein
VRPVATSHHDDVSVPLHGFVDDRRADIASLEQFRGDFLEFVLCLLARELFGAVQRRLALGDVLR